MSRKKKPADSKGTNALPSVAAMNFWSRLKNPPPLLAFAFPEQTDVDEESLEPLLQISKVPVEESFGYSVRIELVGSNPQIWRRVLVKPVTLDILHTVIQLCMGWNDAHLHGFEIRKTRVPLGDEGARIDEKAISITQLHAENIEHFKYTYDFGVDWQHKITIENALPEQSEVEYPQCIDGEGACPLEDFGGIELWSQLLQSRQLPECERNNDLKQRLEHVPPDYDPSFFPRDEANSRLRNAFQKSRGRGRRS